MYNLIFALTRNSTNDTYVMSESVLKDNSVVKITCGDGFGTGPQYVGMVQKYVWLKSDPSSI